MGEGEHDQGKDRPKVAPMSARWLVVRQRRSIALNPRREPLATETAMSPPARR